MYGTSFVVSVVKCNYIWRHICHKKVWPPIPSHGYDIGA